MAVLPILKWPDPRLSQRCAPVAAGEDLTALIADMFDTMYEAPGRGLAAPQVGVTKRVFVMDATWKEGNRSPLAMINPEILERSGQTAAGDEGCLSIPGVLVPVARPVWVRMRWTDAGGLPQSARLEGFAARCAQHEFDHLDGIVTLDRLTPEDRAAALRHYRGGVFA